MMFGRVKPRVALSARTNYTRQTTVNRRNYSTVFPARSEELPGFPKSDFVSTAPKLKTSKTSQGTKVISLSDDSGVASLGVFVNAGSRYENPHNSGVSFILKHLGHQSTNSLTPLRLTREIEAIGATYNVGVGREQIGYFSNVQRSFARAMLEILSETARPRIREFELRFRKHAIEEDIVASESDPKTLLSELLHREAYRHASLGQPLIAPLHNVEHISHEAVEDFVRNHYAPNRITVVAVGGVDHDELASGCEHLFNDGFQRHHLDIARTFAPEQFPNYYYKPVPQGQRITRGAVQKTPAKYVGGEARLPGNFETHLAIAFEGIPLGHRDTHAAGVLQHLLGSGRLHTHEGPGAGFASRLNRNVVQKHSSLVAEASAFNYNYSDSGLFGVYAVGQQGKSAELVNTILGELGNLKNISKDEFNRAKNTYKSQLVFGIQTKPALVENIGAQSLVSDNIQTAEQQAKTVDNVTLEDVIRVSKHVFKSNPTVAAIGDVSNFPVYNNIRVNL